MVKKKTAKKNRNGVNPKQELFCQYYTNDLFGNATLSYSAAYGFELLKLNRTAQRDDEGNIIEESEYMKTYNSCMVMGSNLLRNVKVAARIRKLLRARLDDDAVDTERAFVIMQRDDLGAKVRAITSYDKLKGRIVDKHALTDNDGEPITGIEIVMRIEKK